MRRRSWGALLFLLCLFFVTGCWNRRELNDLALVVAMSIDKAGDQYAVTVQVVDPGEVASKQGSTGRTPVALYSEKGKHIFEVIRRMTTIAPRKLYFAHLQVLVLSEEMAKEGISKPLEFLHRDHELRSDFFVVISRSEKASDILNNLTSLEKIPANKMQSSLRTSERAWAPTVAIQLDELIANMTSEGKNPVLTGIHVTGKEIEKGGTTANVHRLRAYARLHYEDIAVFKKDKLVGWFNENESKGYNYITNRVRSTVGPLQCPKGGELVIEILRAKTKVTGKVIDGKPYINVHLGIEANIGEVACSIDLTKPETIKELERIGDKRGAQLLNAAVEKAKKLQVDVFGFGDVIHRADPQAWKTLRKDWDKHFVDSIVTVSSETHIRRTGTVNQSFLEKVKK